MGLAHVTDVTSIRILDSISLPGRDDRANEDAWGANACAAFVIDGATGLGRPILDPDASDAAWLARMAAEVLTENVKPDSAVGAVVADICRRVRTVVDGLEGPDSPPDWALPVASFQLLHVDSRGTVVTHGLGDCRLLAADADGLIADISPLPLGRSREIESARIAIARAGGLGAMKHLGRDGETLAALRAGRAAYNRPGAEVWTLGAAAEAAAHVASATLPAGRTYQALLCSDGFAALCDLYRRRDALSLVRAAGADGLAALAAELRAIERDEDPEGTLFPRYKTSDDATAVLVEISA